MINIRTAETSDIERMAKLLEELFVIEADFVINREKQIRGLNQLLNSDKDCIFVAESVNDRRVVGMCSVQILISTAEGGEVGMLEDLIVTADYRHQGIGEKLLAAAVNWADRHGLKRMQLLADRNNLSALEFYQKHAWLPTGLICLRASGRIHQ